MNKSSFLSGSLAAVLSVSFCAFGQEASPPPLPDVPAVAAPPLHDSVLVTDSVKANVEGTDPDSALPPALPAAEIVSTKTVVVKGKARGRAQDQRKRMDSDVRKDVLGQDAIRDRADADAASALSHSSGVTLQRSQGEGRFVQIRGTEARLSSVTLDGQKVATSASDTRAMALDVIPVDQLSEIEVTKVLMPEMDGDAIGGSVNLVTPSAQDTQLVLKGFLASGWSALAEGPLWQGSAALSRRFFEDGALGAYLGSSWFRSETGSDAVGIGWDTLDHTRIWELQLRKYRTEKERLGVSGRLDWRLGGSSLVYATGTWNRSRSEQLRQRLEIDRTGKGDLAPYMDSSTNVDVARNVRLRTRTETVALGTVGGSAQLSAVQLDAALTATRAELDQPLSTQATFVPSSRLNVAILPDDPEAPRYYAFYYPRPIGTDPRFENVSSYVLSRLDPQWTKGDERDVHGRLDAKLCLGADSAWQLKAGAKLGWKEKSQTVGGNEYTFAAGAKPPSLTAFSPTDAGTTFYQGTYGLGAMPDAGAVDAWLATNRAALVERAQDNHLVFDPQNYRVEERHVAGFGQLRWKQPGLTAVGGLRYERYDLRSTGNDVRLQADESWDTTVEVVSERTMQFLLPMASLRWEVSPGLQLRLGGGRSFVLPDIKDLVPTRRTDLLDYTVEEGNPDLRPTLADALDLGVEWSRKPRALAAAGLFAKRLTDYVFPATYTSWDPIRKVVFTHFGKANGDEATLLGAELELAQPLDFLPGFLAGLGVEANYTRTWSSTCLPGRSEDGSLPGQSDHSGTTALRFERWGFTALLSWTFQGPLRYEIAPVEERDTWVDWHNRLDASVSQRLGKGWLLFLQASNLTDAAYRIYEGDDRHPVQIEYSGISGQLGLRVSL